MGNAGAAGDQMAAVAVGADEPESKHIFAINREGGKGRIKLALSQHGVELLLRGLQRNVIIRKCVQHGRMKRWPVDILRILDLDRH